jgi:hypothetical protein
LGLKARDEKLSPPITGLALLIPAVTDSDRAPEKFKPYLKSMEQNKNAPILGKPIIDKFMGGFFGPPAVVEGVR